MSYESCLEQIARDLGKDKLTKAQTKEWSQVVDKVLRNAEAAGKTPDQVRATLSNLVKDEVQGLRTAEFHAFLNRTAQVRLIDFVQSEYPTALAKGFEAAITGIQHGTKGAGRSVFRDIATARAELSRVQDRLIKEGVWDVAKSGDLDLQLHQAVWARRDGTPTDHLPEAAVKIVDILIDYRDRFHTRANAAGAKFGDLMEWLGTRRHDQYKIGAVSQEQYVKWVAELGVDWERSYPLAAAEDRVKILERLYLNFRDGVHLKDPQPSTGMKGVGNLGRSLSHDRKLHFLTPEAEHAYQKKFGSGTVLQSFFQSMSGDLRTFAVMSKFGPNAGLNIRDALRHVAKKASDAGDTAQAKEIQDFQATFERIYEGGLDGRNDVPHRPTLAAVTSHWRVVDRVMNLGSSMISSFNDTVTRGAAVHRVFGGSQFAHTVAAWKDVVPFLSSHAERVDFLSRCSIELDHMATLGADFHEEGARGLFARGQELFFNLNGQNWWTAIHRTGAAKGLADSLGRAARSGEVLPWTKQFFERHGISDPEWDVIRTTAYDEGGKVWITPDQVGRISDDQIRSYIVTKGAAEATGRPRAGSAITDWEVARTRERLETDLAGLFNDYVGQAVVNPDLKTHAWLAQGTQRGTALGEGLRGVMLFKSYPTAFIQKAIGPTLLGHSTDPRQTAFQALRSANGIAGIAKLMAGMTAVGYVSNVVTDLLKGWAPGDPTEHPWEYTRRALLRGGGFAFLGDFLFGEMTKGAPGTGTGVFKMFGPQVGDVEKVYDLLSKGREGELKPREVANALVKSTPFVNGSIFWTNLAAQHAYLRELAGSEALYRIERDRREKLGQTPLVW